MRTNLQCPFQDKDLAKQLGARWDPKLRVWYVENVPDLGPFARWLPDGPAPATAVDARRANAVQRPANPAPGLAPERSAQGSAVITGPALVADCGCAALPWEPCDCPAPAAAANRSLPGRSL
jgi:Domain of unknown function (DUF5710)